MLECTYQLFPHSVRRRWLHREILPNDVVDVTFSKVVEPFNFCPVAAQESGFAAPTTSTSDIFFLLHNQAAQHVSCRNAPRPTARTFWYFLITMYTLRIFFLALRFDWGFRSSCSAPITIFSQNFLNKNSSPHRISSRAIARSITTPHSASKSTTVRLRSIRWSFTFHSVSRESFRTQQPPKQYWSCFTLRTIGLWWISDH